MDCPRSASKCPRKEDARPGSRQHRGPSGSIFLIFSKAKRFPPTDQQIPGAELLPTRHSLRQTGTLRPVSWP